MNKTNFKQMLIYTSAFFAIGACEPIKSNKQMYKAPASSTQSKTSELNQLANQYFKALPSDIEGPDSNPNSQAKKQLGQLLFHEARLSKSKAISCNTCHLLANYGVDSRPVSAGHNGQLGDRNSPTVFHAGFQLAQFWDGRASSLEEQAGGPILNPVEMAMPDEQSVVKRLEGIPGYLPLFKEAFPGQAQPITYENLTRAIATFERSLLTPSRFDQYLNGQESALNEKEQKGLKQFITQGCIACHAGVALGGERFEKFGLSQNVENITDSGRFKVTGKAFDKEVFKVPTLRNIDKTAPYFHDGNVKDLKEAVKLMGQSQLGKDLNEEELDLLVAFLKALTGEIPEELKKQPKLP